MCFKRCQKRIWKGKKRKELTCRVLGLPFGARVRLWAFLLRDAFLSDVTIGPRIGTGHFGRLEFQLTPRNCL